MADDRIVIYAKLLSGDIIPLRVSPIEPILSIKARLAKKSKDLDPVYMKLFDEAGDQLEDSEMIGNVLSNESTVNVFVDLDQERDVSRERSELKLYRKSMAEKLRREKEEKIRLEMEQEKFERRRQQIEEYERAKKMRKQELDRQWEEQQAEKKRAQKEREMEEKRRLREDEEYRIQKERELEDYKIRLLQEEEDRENNKKYFLIRDPIEREKFLSSTMSKRRWDVNKLKAKRIAEDLYRKSKRLIFPYRPPQEEEEEEKSSICNRINCALFKSYSGKRRSKKRSRSKRYRTGRR